MADISVVITCYNLEKYIGQAVQSVLDQSFIDNLQIIVVDDCSTDGSAEAVKGLPVEYLKTPENSGVLLATVYGIRHCKSDLVAFLDGDDIWHEDKLKYIVKAFNSFPNVGLVTHDLRYVDGNGVPLSRQSRPYEVLSAEPTKEKSDDLVRQGILSQSDYVWLGSALSIRRSVVDAEGFCRFVETLPDARNTYQDWPLAVWCAANRAAQMAYIPHKLFYYRLHMLNHSGDASSTEKAIRNVYRTFNTLKACESIMSRFGDDSPALRKTVRKSRYYNCLLNLYQGKRLSALFGFLSSLKYLFSGNVRLVKELARFSGVFFLGYSGFVKLARRLR